jgi:hypothetical protein
LKGSVRWAAEIPFISKVSPFAVSLPLKFGPYQLATPDSINSPFFVGKEDVLMFVGVVLVEFPTVEPLRVVPHEIKKRKMILPVKVLLINCIKVDNV